MTNILFNDEAYEYWRNKQYWSVDDILNLHFGGIENLFPQDREEFLKTEDLVLNAILSGELKSKKCNGRAYATRDDAIAWASSNLPNFPFRPNEFEKAPRSFSKQEETLLGIIGGLSTLLALHNRHAFSFETGGVNSNGIAEKLTKLAEGKRGFKNSNLRDVISKGLNLFNE